MEMRELATTTRYVGAISISIKNFKKNEQLKRDKFTLINNSKIFFQLQGGPG